MDGFLRSHNAMRFPHNIKQARVHLRRFITAPITQKPIKLLQSGLIIRAVALIGDVQRFFGMDMINFDCARIAIGDGIADLRRSNRP